MKRNLARNPELNSFVEIVQSYVAHERREEPATITIDSIVQRGRPAPDFVLMDAEGAEALILSGGRQVLTEHHPSLIIETHGPLPEQQCLDMLDEFGYTSHYFVQRRRWWREDRNAEVNRWLIAPRPLGSPF